MNRSLVLHLLAYVPMPSLDQDVGILTAKLRSAHSNPHVQDGDPESEAAQDALGCGRGP